MVQCCVFIFIFCMSFLCLFLSNQGKWHHITYHRKLSESSAPPITAPQPSSPLAPITSPQPSSPLAPITSPQPSSPLAPEPSRPLAPTASPEPSSPLAPITSPEPSSSPLAPKTGFLDVRHFGAVGDGVTDDTEAFKMAWDSACQLNSSVIYVPNGFSFMIQPTIFTGPCQSGLVFQVDGTLMPPDGPEMWPKNSSKILWLVFYKVNEMSLQGDGVIDGRGQKWWDLPCKPHKGKNGTTLPGPCDSPVAIRFFKSSNLTVKGLRVKDSPQFHFRFDGCQNVHVESLTITAPALSPNTDGIHIGNSNGVRIYNSHISNGDDCVSIGSGCYDVDIRNITCGPGGHGISIGSLGSRNSAACVHNITVRDSMIKYSDNGVRIKTWQGGSGAVFGITYSNIHMENVLNPMIIDQFYCLKKECKNQTSAVKVWDILYEGIKGTYDVRRPPMHFGCSDSVPCTNLTLADIQLLPAEGNEVLEPFCWNAYGELDTVTIPPVFCLKDGVPGSKLGNKTMDYC